MTLRRRKNLALHPQAIETRGVGQGMANRTESSPKTPATAPLFRQEVLEFQQQNRQWGRVVPLQPLSTYLLVWSIIGTAAVVIGFLFIAQYARKEVAVGYLAPVSGSARVFVAQPGTITSVFIQQGETVEKDQPLLAVSTEQVSANGEELNATILATLGQQRQALMRNMAEVVQRTDSERQRLTTEVQEHESVLSQLDAQSEVQRTRIMILQKLVEAGALLRSKGLVSEPDQKHREETMLEQQQALIGLNQQVITRKGQLSGVRYNLEQLPFTQSEKIQALRNELAATDQRIADTKGHSAFVVRAPLAGRITLLHASVGEHADPRRLQLQIVPESAMLQAELYIPVRAIGFVEPGQDVRLLFDAFPYQRFGTYHGRITQVSQSVLLPSDVEGGPLTLREPAYMATVALDRSNITANGKTIRLQPDMSLRADIVLEKRTLADWIFAPLRHLRIEG